MEIDKQLHLVKLGGSVITDKDEIEEANESVIFQLAFEIHQAKLQRPQLNLILGHGAGSFGHPQANEYQTHMGIREGDGGYGIAKVRQAGMKLHTKILDSLIALDLPAAGLPPFAFLTSSSKVLDEINVNPLRLMLAGGLLPVTHGDVIMDRVYGCRIVSGETVLNLFAEQNHQLGFKSGIVIEIGKTDGVYGPDGKTIELIARSNFGEVLDHLGGSESVDVTGGMKHKVEEAYALARIGVPTLITSANPGNLKNALLGKDVKGTWIRA